MPLTTLNALPALAIIAYLVGSAVSRFAPRSVSPVAASLSAGIAFGAAAISGLFLAAAPGRTTVSGGLIYFDALSAVILSLIAFVGLIVVRFSCNYLGGNPRRHVFLSRMCATLACITTVVIAGDLRLLVVAWIATSLTLHRLLMFYGDRPRAVIAARKKFIAARLGDAALVAAAVILAHTFGTTSIKEVIDAAGAGAPVTNAGWPLLLAPVLLAAAAVLKSAQFPMHGWLIEVMETPTPVSALLHAGIVNAGGFLIIRFADVMLLNAPAMHLLALIGGFSALFGSIVMLTQTSIKASLAYSTVAQMGFMLLQCGLGAFASATLHIFAHSLYKAHAFLSSGRAVHLARIPRPALSQKKRDALLALAASLAIYIAAGQLIGGAAKAPAVFALGAIFIFGLAMYLSALLAMPPGRVIGVALAAGSATLYFLMQNIAASLLRDSVPAPGAPDAIGWLVMALAVLSFAFVAMSQVYQFPFFAELRRRFYVHASNGFYANAAFNRLIGALRRRATA